MAWKYDISILGGDKLHMMIAESDGSHETMAGILKQLQFCCRNIAGTMMANSDLDADEFISLAKLIEGEPELCQSEDYATICEFGYSSLEELVDARLEQFYDVCDQYRVWVGDGFTQAQGRLQMEEMTL